jgi:carboxylate-amine ligase
MLPALTIGIEEEYLLVDPETRDLVADPPPEFMKGCQDALGSRVTPEFLRCQVEIGTPVCNNVAEARRSLVASRRAIINNAEKCGMRMIAASTHPFAMWREQQHTAAPRYDHLDQDMKGVIRRMLICGMHVHAGIEDPEARIDLMNQARYFLPHLLALSTSSPFWQGNDMGMKCSRLSVFDGMPRTGIPDRFDSWSEYERMLKMLVDVEAIEDATKIWWDMRPSARFPTVEMRITDVCTRLEDALTIAALYQSILRMLARLKQRNLRWRIYPRLMLNENRWQAQRFGISRHMIDMSRGICVDFGSLTEELIEIVTEDATALECLKEVQHAREILKRGTSACRQLAVYEQATAEGLDNHEALKRVVDHLIEETAADLPEST